MKWPVAAVGFLTTAMGATPDDGHKYERQPATRHYDKAHGRSLGCPGCETAGSGRQRSHGRPEAAMERRSKVRRDTPGRGFFYRLHLGLFGGQTRLRLRLVDLSRIPDGTFFRELHPASEMASQNDQNKAK